MISTQSFRMSFNRYQYWLLILSHLLIKKEIVIIKKVVVKIMFLSWKHCITFSLQTKPISFFLSSQITKCPLLSFNSSNFFNPNLPVTYILLHCQQFSQRHNHIHHCKNNTNATYFYRCRHPFLPLDQASKPNSTLKNLITTATADLQRSSCLPPSSENVQWSLNFLSVAESKKLWYEQYF